MPGVGGTSREEDGALVLQFLMDGLNPVEVGIVDTVDQLDGGGIVVEVVDETVHDGTFSGARTRW